jgi:hypothetical protein
LDWVHRDQGLLAAVEYAKNGDAGALRFLSARFPGLEPDELAAALDSYGRRSMPFGDWARRIARNKVVAEDAGGDGPPPGFVNDLSDALRRLTPPEREALKQALSRSE